MFPVQQESDFIFNPKLMRHQVLDNTDQDYPDLDNTDLDYPDLDNPDLDNTDLDNTDLNLF